MQKSLNAFRTISEVAAELEVPQHVLRFWESKFSQIRPLKRAGGRRYYRPDDVNLLRCIRGLLYGDGYTIKGVQKVLKERGPRFTGGKPAEADAIAAGVTARQIPQQSGDAASTSKTMRKRERPRWDPDEMSLPISLPEIARPHSGPGAPSRQVKGPETQRLSPAQRKKLEKLLTQLSEIQHILKST